MTTVLTLLTREEQHSHQATIEQWLVDNHIDVSNLAPGWISIERNDNGDDAGTGTGTDGPNDDTDEEPEGDLFIRYHAFKRDTAGNRIPDPDGRNQSWVEERTTPLATELPDLTLTDTTEYAA